MENEVKVTKDTEENDTLDRLRIVKSKFETLKERAEKDSSMDNILECIFKFGALENEYYKLYVNSTNREVRNTYDYDMCAFKKQLFSMIKKSLHRPPTVQAPTVSDDTKPYDNYTAKERRCQEGIKKIKDSISEIYSYLSEEDQNLVDFGRVSEQVDSVYGIFEEE